MKRRRDTARLVRIGVAAVSIAALLTGCGATEPAPPKALPATGGGAKACPAAGRDEPQAPPTSIGGTPANTPEGLRLSQAVGDQGRGAFADVYATHITDLPPGRVALCVTDLARGRLLVEAAHRADPGFDPGRVDLYSSPYSARALGAVSGKLCRIEEAFPVYACAAAPGATGVEVDSDAAGAASAAFRERLSKAAGGVPVTVREGRQVVPAVG
ncbi:hypothetical protein ABT236_16895 [Streptomyces sp. NPDC001523]|uniref:hypothetical protein n=1 Tax=Streptomyces sp. NPDC001523 TaxID=3154383 RepID=UPI00332D8AF2